MPYDLRSLRVRAIGRAAVTVAERRLRGRGGIGWDGWPWAAEGSKAAKRSKGATFCGTWGDVALGESICYTRSTAWRGPGWVRPAARGQEEASMRVIDADTHVDETEDTWEYLLPSERAYRPTCDTDPSDGKQYWTIDGNRFLRIPRDFAKTGTTVEARELKDVRVRLADMDRMGTEVQVIYPTVLLLAPAQRPEVDLAVRRAYNRWVGERCDASGGRLRWVCLPPVGLMDAALEELCWAKAHGAVGVMKKGDPEFGKWPADPYFFPLYEEAQRLDLPLCFHQGTGMSDIQTGADFSLGRFQRLPLSVVNGFYSFVANSIPQRFPRLRYGFIEAGASWVPYVTYDLKRRFLKQPDGGNIDGVKFEVQDDLFRANRCFVTCQVDEDLPYILQFAAPETFVVGSDYGHSDPSVEHQFLPMLEARARDGAIPPDAVRKITYDNAKALYGL